MQSVKEVKKWFKKEASKDPNKYYATSVLKEEGFIRKKCKCGTYYWTVSDAETCGDPDCSGGFRFIGKTPAKNKMDYIETWERFAKLFKKLGYTPIDRYPVVARWRDDTDFVQASIYDFQPYVVSGEVKPPANPLVVPQFCLRFNDIDNVGITGAHYTGFVMIGQHMFVPESEWNQDKVFSDIHNWLREGMGLPNEEITFHEDAWAGGGNFGPCMEYFSRGLELGNQVYMLYEQTPSGNKALQLKVLDMGAGHERFSWFTKGTSTSYESTFPTVCNKLYKIADIKVDNALMKKFLPYSSYLNVDEVDDIDKTWQKVAHKIKTDVKDLKQKILPLAALYSVAEHSRSLLVALSDGALPSNVGGGYNLRVILRRALSFIDKYGWDIDLGKITEWHADYLRKLFPELSENLGEVNEVLKVEKSKYESTKEKSRKIVARIVKEDITEAKLLELYDSQGISPEIISEEASKLGKNVLVPDNFYAKVTDMHESKEQAHATVKEDKLGLDGVDGTRTLYFDDYSLVKFKAKIIKVIDNKIILDQTAFYPTSGGQIHDIGTIANEKVVDVFKQGNVIVHVLTDKHKFPLGEEVKCEIDLNRRKQLAQHHTAAHIVNAAAKKVLGRHINQAGAKKTVEKAHLDVTHYKAVSEDEMEKIEKEANLIVGRNIKIKLYFITRDEAEKKFGMSIYQGGAVPGNKLRLVEIPGVDVECCGGTHLNNTSEACEIKLLKATKISDGIVRIVFTAGDAALEIEDRQGVALNEIAKALQCKPTQVPGRASELFTKWKQAVKKKIKLEKYDLISEEEFDGDILKKTAEVLKTQPEHVIKTIRRFKEELSKAK